MPPEIELEDIKDAALPKDLLGKNEELIDIRGDKPDELEIEWLDDDSGVPESLKGQNEDVLDPTGQSHSTDELGDETSSRTHEEIQRERQRYQQAEQQWLTQQEALERQVVESRKASVQAQADSFKLALDGIDVRLRTAQEGLKYARQEQDYSTEEDLRAQIDQLKDMRRSIEGNMAQLPSAEDFDREYEQYTRQRRAQMQRQRASDVRGLNERANKWIERNAWFHDPGMAHAKKSVLEINDALASENYDPNSAEFFQELNRRLKRKHGDLKLADLDDGKAKSPGRPVASSRTQSPVGQTTPQHRRTGKVTLDQSDLMMMKQFGLNPSDKKAQQYFAKSKRDRLAREAR